MPSDATVKDKSYWQGRSHQAIAKQASQCCHECLATSLNALAVSLHYCDREGCNLCVYFSHS